MPRRLTPGVVDSFVPHDEVIRWVRRYRTAFFLLFQGCLGKLTLDEANSLIQQGVQGDAVPLPGRGASPLFSFPF